MESPGDGLGSERYLKQLLQTLSPEDLGRRLRSHRMNAGLSVRDLAQRAMLSKTSIVSLEHGKGGRPVTIEKVCRALNLHVVRLASSEGEKVDTVQGQGDGEWFALDELSQGPLSPANMTDQEREALRANVVLMFKNVPADAGFIAGIVEVAQATGERSHPGGEFGYVLRGTMVLTLNGHTHDVRQSESFYVPSGVPHSYGPVSDEIPRVLLFRLA